MHLKVFVKLKKTLKTLSSGQKNLKKPKKTQKIQKNPKKPKKPHWAGFFKKKPGFFQPWMREMGQLRERNVKETGKLRRGCGLTERQSLITLFLY
jgi:hypothetical protein